MSKAIVRPQAPAPIASSAETLLGLVRAEATKFGRCCDLYQDGFGTFADHECQQRTFAMLRSVQQVLGVDKEGAPLTKKEVAEARSRAILNAAAPALLAALEEVMEALRVNAPGTPLNNHRFDSVGIKAYAAIAKARS